MPIPVPTSIVWTDAERAQLEAWSRRGSRAGARVALADRARRGRGPNNTDIAAQLGVAVSSVRKWRNRFAEQRLDGLSDEPRTGRPQTITDEQIDAVITKTGEQPA